MTGPEQGDNANNNAAPDERLDKVAAELLS